MRITEAALRRIVREEIMHEISLPNFLKAKKIDPQLSTMKHLRALIKQINSEKRSEKGLDALKDVGQGFLLDLVPGGSTMMSLAGALRGMYKMPDDKKTDTKLDLLNIDDDVSKIVDDTVEDNFLNQVASQLDQLGDNEEIPDMTKVLSKYLQGKYDSRTVSGFSEGTAPRRARPRR
jgi:hypothetical protein